MLEEDRAVGETAVAPSADLIDHQMAETVPLVEVAAAMEMGPGDVPRDPQLETAVATRLTEATEIHSAIVYSMVLPRTETMLMDLAQFSR